MFRVLLCAILASAGFAQRRQEPRPPYPYSSEDVVFENRAATIHLAATLTLPPGKGPFPAAVLLNGSGRQDRDDTIFGHKLFLVIADYLTRNGIAVLRYDDRGAGGSSGDYDAATTADLSTDAEAALAYLQTRAAVDPKRIGFIGHSEGGVIGPMVAARNSSVAFVVSLAGNGVKGGEVLYAQGRAIRRAAGASEAELDGDRAMHNRIMAAMDLSDRAQAAKALGGIFGDSPAAQAQIKAMLGPWMRFFITYDPAVALEKVKCPVLALNGDRDMQVIADQNLPAWEAALKKAGNRDVTVRKLPGLNHLFQTCVKCAPDEYSEIEETISPKALEIVADWLQQRFGPAR